MKKKYTFVGIIFLVGILASSTTITAISVTNNFSIQDKDKINQSTNLRALYGYVYDKQTGEPIEGARILRLQHDSPDVVYTDSNGYYSVDVIPCMCYKFITATIPGYTTDWTYVPYGGFQHDFYIYPNPVDLWCETEIVDFGEVRPGKSAYYDITIENRGIKDAFLNWEILNYDSLNNPHKFIKFSQDDGIRLEGGDKETITIEAKVNPKWSNKYLYTEIVFLNTDKQETDFFVLPIMFNVNDDLDALKINGYVTSKNGDLNNVTITIKEIRDDSEVAKEWKTRTWTRGYYSSIVYNPEWKQYSIQASKDGWYSAETIVEYNGDYEIQKVNLSMMKSRNYEFLFSKLPIISRLLNHIIKGY